MHAYPAFPAPVRSAWRRRALRLPRSVTRFGGSRPAPGAVPAGLVVTLHADPGCDASSLARRVAPHLGVPVLDGDLPVRVADALGIPLADALTLDGTAPSPLLQAVLWSGFVTPSPEILGAVAEADVITRCFHQTEDVIREAAADGDGVVVVGRAAAFVLAGHPTALHVRLTAPGPLRAARLGLASIDAADRAAARVVRHGYRAVLADEAFHLVLDDREEGIEVLVAAAARQREAVAARGSRTRD